MKKTIFLLLTLAIPVSIFLFLKFFGSNEFDVPVLYDNGIDNCENSTAPHVIPEEFVMPVVGQLQADTEGRFKVFGVLEKSEDNTELFIQLVRIQDAFYEVGSPLFMLYVQDGNGDAAQLQAQLIEVGMNAENVSIIALSHLNMDEFLRCGIGLINEEGTDLRQLVLVDKEQRIRGMYKSLEMEQTDQLILELKILKQKV